MLPKTCLDRKLLTETEITVRPNSIPDMIKDEDNFDLHIIEKYFTNNASNYILRLAAKSRKKKQMDMPRMSKKIKREDSVSCYTCPRWYHLQCTSLNEIPKKQNWFYRPCKSKYT